MKISGAFYGITPRVCSAQHKVAPALYLAQCWEILLYRGRVEGRYRRRSGWFWLRLSGFALRRGQLRKWEGAAELFCTLLNWRDDEGSRLARCIIPRCPRGAHQAAMLKIASRAIWTFARRLQWEHQRGRRYGRKEFCFQLFCSCGKKS